MLSYAEMYGKRIGSSVLTIEQKAIVFPHTKNYKYDPSKSPDAKVNFEAFRFCQSYITGTQIFERCEHKL